MRTADCRGKEAIQKFPGRLLEFSYEVFLAYHPSAFARHWINARRNARCRTTAELNPPFNRKEQGFVRLFFFAPSGLM